MQKKKWIGIVAIVLVVAVVTVGLLLQEKQHLEQQRNEALEELVRNAGQYDEQSIVLYNTSKAKSEKLAAMYGAELRITANGRFATLKLPEGTTIRDVFAMEESLQYIDDMAPDYQVKVSELTQEEETSGEKLPTRPQYSVSDEDYELQTYLDYLNMGSVWNQYTGYGVTIAVIDTGIDTDHPEFAGRISEYSYNATEDKIVKDYLLEDGSYDWSLIEDEQGHGTAVTGVLAASMNSGNVVGIAPDVNIIVIKAECDARGNFYRTSDLVYGLYYAIERDVQVVNMSFGTTAPRNPFEGATQLAYDSDIICVAAAGNHTTAQLTWPAADEKVIGVGALGEGWTLADYSNYGENTDLVAPGSTYTTRMGGTYGRAAGTSLASPIVAGAIALFMQHNYYTTFDTVQEILYASCYDLGDLGRDWYYGFGALDISAFLLEKRGTIIYDMLTDELENQEGIFIEGHTLQQLPEPERLYAVFDGWYYDDTFTQKYNYYADKFYGEVTLYAKWVNEEDGVPYTYVILEDGTVEIRSYTGHRRYITIPEKIEDRIVSSIGDFAFSGQTQLREVTLPSGLNHIGLGAFANCANLVHMEIPENVTEIEERAFANNVRLSSLTFLGTSKLQRIGDYAFQNCCKLERIELPASVRSINGSAFYGCTALSQIYVLSGNTAFTSKEGVLFNYSGSTLVAFPAAWGSSYVLPEQTRYIGDCAFACARLKQIALANVQSIGASAFANAALETVTIPDGVTNLGAYAFQHNTNLTQITIGRGVSKLPASVFADTTALETITIPKGITVIDGYAFNGSALRTVQFEEGSMLTAIGDYAFACCSISEIDIPASVLSIGDAAFIATPLMHVRFGENSVLRTIGGEAFAACWCLETIELPDSLQVIGALAFESSGLTAITIPAGVVSIGDGAFSGCTSLGAVTVEEGNTVYQDLDGVVYTLDHTTIHTYPAGRTDSHYAIKEGTQIVAPWAFGGAVHLNSVTLPDTLEQISEYGFVRCVSLQQIHIPDNVILIGRCAFSEDYSLRSITFDETSKLSRIGYQAFAYCGITSFTVPANVSTMAQRAFEGCWNLSEITFAENSKLESISAYVFVGCTNIWQITFLPGSALTSIQAHGLEGMKNLTTIDFGDAKLTNVDNFAFRFCQSLSALELPETLTNIGRYAFCGCESLSELKIPENVEHVGSYAFLGTTDLELFFLSETLPDYLDENWDRGIRGYYTGITSIVEEGDYRYATLTSGGIAILAYWGQDTHIDLTTLDLGGPVTIIGGGAFAESGVESVVLPDSLTAIQETAFAYCPLQTISIPASVTFIGREAFAHTDLTSLTFAPGSQLSVMEQYAFEGTKKLTSVTLPASLTTMGTGVFLESGLESVTFENGIRITEIPQKAFANTKLTEVVLPDSVTLVNHNAFNNVQTLKRVTFGDNTGIRLMSNAFYHTGLEQLHIPANVTYIGEYCFVALSNLTEFTVDADNPNYKAEDGLLLNKSGRKLIAVPAGRTGTLTVPASVEEIGFGAFEESKLSQILFCEDANILTFGYRAFFKAENITTITIPQSVVSIDYYAFAYCKNLQEVVFAEGNQLKGIYEGAFIGCNNLEEITIPATVVEISDFAFYGCSKIDQIPVADESVLKGIYDYAFAYTGLRGELTIPETLIDIGDYAFLGTKLTYVTIPDTNKKALIIGIGAFEACNQLESITLPFLGASYEDDQINWFGYIFGAGGYKANASYVPESLKTVTITEGISVVGTGCFAGCTNLETIHVPHSVSVVWDYAFADTTARYTLTNTITTYHWNGSRTEMIATDTHFGKGMYGQIQLAEGVARIAGEAFGDLKNLQSVVLPDTVTVIEGLAFIGCENLQSVTLSEKLDQIGRYAFSGCYNLQAIHVPSVAVWCNVTLASHDASPFDQTGAKLMVNGEPIIDLVIPEGVTKIGDYAFRGYGALESVTIPESVESIGQYAFYNCDGLKVVNMPSDLASMGDHAFAYCDNLQHITIPAGITEIPGHVFASCSSLTDMVIPDGVTTIGNSAFSSCGSLECVVIPDGVTTIGAYAFSYCNLESIVIPKSVTNIESNAFSWSFETKVYISDLTAWCNITFADEDANPLSNVLYLNGEPLIDLVIPEGVTTIHDYAFYNAYGMASVTIPASVSSIGQMAFYYCESLYSVHNNSNLNMMLGSSDHGCAAYYGKVLIDSAGNKFFADGCEETADGFLFKYENGTYQLMGYAGTEDTVTLPDSIHGSSYEIVRFQGAKHVIIPEGVTTIGEEAFYNAAMLQTVTLPESVTSIGASAFFRCVNLTSINMPSGLNSIGSDAFYACQSLQEVVLPDSVSYIGRSAFSGCSALTSITLPNSLTEINNSMFSYCSSLTSIELPDTVQRIGQYAFQDCISLTGVRIPFGVDEIRQSTFNGCSSMTWVDIPFSVTYIGYYAFANCDSLTEISIPTSVTSIGGSALPAGAAITFVGDNPAFAVVDGILYSADMRELIALCAELSGDIVIPEGVLWIEDNVFENCTEITGIQLPESLYIIGNRAFYGCTGLTSIDLPDNVVAIGDAAFSNCTNLTHVDLPESLTGIAERMFDGCTSLESISIPAKVSVEGIHCSFRDCNLKQVYITDLAAWCELDMEDCALFSEGTGLYLNGELVRDLVIPDGITTVQNYAFYHYSYLTSVVMPDSVVSIGQNAFRNCENLQHVTIGNGVTTLGREAFMGCTNLTSIVIPAGLTQIGSDAFWMCDNVAQVYIADLEAWFNVTFENSRANPMSIYGTELYVNGEPLRELVLPAGMTAIPDYAFYGCSSLEKVIIPEAVTSIGSAAFAYCINLREVVIPDSVQNIGMSTFSGCTSLCEVVLPEGLDSIPYHMFYDCYSLETIDIPSSVQSIGGGAFYGCVKLQNIALPDGLTCIEQSAFYDCYGLRHIVIPDSVTTIEDSAFYYCGLTELVIPDSVTQIGYYAFAYNHYLRTVTLGRNLQVIGTDAFMMSSEVDVLYNYSALELTLDSGDHGGVASYAWVLIDANGNKTFRSDYHETADGFVYSLTYNWKGEPQYTMVGYLGDGDTVTLPMTIDDRSYTVDRFFGAKYVIFPEGVTNISNSAFYHNRELLGVTIPNSVTSIGNGAFSGCSGLTSITLPENLQSIYGQAFSGCTGLGEIHIPDRVSYIGRGAFPKDTLADPEYLTHGMVVVDGWLVEVAPEVKYLYNIQGLRGAAQGAYDDCNLLKDMVWDGSSNYPSNVETIYVMHIWERAEFIPDLLTLKNIVICDSVGISDLIGKYSFISAVDATIFVEELETNLRWDVNFPGWSNGNKVVYGDQWHWVSFCDENGQTIFAEPCLNAQIIRLPVHEIAPNEKYVYEIVGWDLDGDGKPDSIPATSVVDIHAKLVVTAQERLYTVQFADRITGTVYHSLQLPYGASITAPADPAKQGYDFVRWESLRADTTVTGDMVIYAVWQHHGDGHVYAEPVWVEATCTEPGFYKYACTICGEYYGADYTQPVGHDYQANTVMPGCIAEGYTQHSCSRCGDTYRDQFTPATGHSYGQWIVDVAAACETLGKQHHICDACGHYEEESIPAKGHSFAVTDSVASTCAAAGEQTLCCTDCGVTITEQLPLKVHSYEKEYAPVSFLEWLAHLQIEILWGYEGDHAFYYRCGECGHVMPVADAEEYGVGVESVACRHTTSTWVVARQPDCMGKGVETNMCDHCGELLDVKIYGEQGDHSYESVVTEPTCTESGLATHTCTVCGDSYTEPIPALDHSFVDGICEHCGELEVQIALGDINGDGWVDVEDAMLILQLEAMLIEEDGLNLSAADVNGDGWVDVEDAMLILQYDALLIDEFPVAGTPKP